MVLVLLARDEKTEYGKLVKYFMPELSRFLRDALLPSDALALCTVYAFREQRDSELSEEKGNFF